MLVWSVGVSGRGRLVGWVVGGGVSGGGRLVWRGRVRGGGGWVDWVLGDAWRGWRMGWWVGGCKEAVVGRRRKDMVEGGKAHGGESGVVRAAETATESGCFTPHLALSDGQASVQSSERLNAKVASGAVSFIL